jgi:hypothetical protein
MSQWKLAFLCPQCKTALDEYDECCVNCGHFDKFLHFGWKIKGSKRWIDTTPPKKWYQFWIKKTGYWEYKK